jgi:hypothetical protein
VVAALCAATVLGGCSIDKQSAPALAGPSGFGLSFTMAASPTSLPRDGHTETTITIVARDASGAPKPNVPLLVEVSPSVPVVALDRETRTDGSARFVVTAPTTDVVAPIDNNVVLWVVPQGEAIGNDYQNARFQSVRVNLLGPRNATYPSPEFTFSPEAPKPMGSVVLDATKTTDEGTQCVTCTYIWNVEGIQISGPVVSVFFGAPGNYSVILTVIDFTGTRSQTGKVIEVKAEEEEEEEPMDEEMP